MANRRAGQAACDFKPGVKLGNVLWATEGHSFIFRAFISALMLAAEEQPTVRLV